jgi:hypothetical protein
VVSPAISCFFLQTSFVIATETLGVFPSSRRCPFRWHVKTGHSLGIQAFDEAIAELDTLGEES